MNVLRRLARVLLFVIGFPTVLVLTVPWLMLWLPAVYVVTGRPIDDLIERGPTLWLDWLLS